VPELGRTTLLPLGSHSTPSPANCLRSRGPTWFPGCSNFGAPPAVAGGKILGGRVAVIPAGRPMTSSSESKRSWYGVYGDLAGDDSFRLAILPFPVCRCPMLDMPLGTLHTQAPSAG